MRIHRPLQLIPMLICLVVQVWAGPNEPEPPEPARSHVVIKKNITASIVRINILKARGPVAGAAAQSLIINGSIIDSYHPRIVEVYPATGIVLDDKGHILTYLGERWIDLGSQNQIEVLIPGDHKKAAGNLIGVDERTGFAVILSPEVKLQPARIEPPDNFKVGSIIYIVGFPKAFMPIVKRGRITKPLALPAPEVRWAVSAASGSECGDPIMDPAGNIIGVSTGFLPPPAARKGLAQIGVVSLIDVMPVVQKIIATGRSIPSGWVGVFLDELTPEVRQHLSLRPDQQGVLVREVVRGGPAERAGIKQNDVLIQSDATAITNMRQFVQLVRDAPIGRILPVTVIRNGQSKLLRLKIAARKDSAMAEQLFTMQQQPALEIDLQELETRLAETMARIKEAELRLKDDKTNQKERQKALQQLEAAKKSLSEEAIARPLVKIPSRRPTLGLFTDNLTTQLGDYFGVKDGKGVLITWVAQGSPSEKAGLKAGDVIVKIDDAAAPDRLTLARQLERKRNGNKVKVSVLRERNPMDFYLTVENEPGFKFKRRR